LPRGPVVGGGVEVRHRGWGRVVYRETHVSIPNAYVCDGLAGRPDNEERCFV